MQLAGLRTGEAIAKPESAEPTEDDLRWAAAWAPLIPGRSVLGHKKAVEALDHLTSPAGKEALRRIFKDEETFDAMLTRSFSRVRYNLSGGYWQARTIRTISGGRATGGKHGTVQQTGGNVPTDQTKDE